jgi:predicted nucleotidyltransferase
MHRDQVKGKLLPYASELRAEGVLHLALHGSVARGEETPESDVDLIAELDRSRKISLIGFIHLENRLADILGVKVDLSDKIALRPDVAENAERDSILVF